MALFKYRRRNPETGKTEPYGAWIGQWTDANGVVRRESLSNNKAAAEAMLGERIKQAEFARAGVVDRFADWRRVPLVDHLAAWKSHQLALGVSGAQVNLTHNRAARILEESRATWIHDLSPSRILGAVEHLTKEGNLSHQTRNFYVSAVKQFAKWLLTDGRCAENPLATLAGKKNVKLDQRHQRRALSREECERLLRSPLENPSRHSMLPQDRHWLYRLALSTGFRASELASLTPESIDVEKKEVTIKAAYAKNRREDVLPLPDHLFPDLADWLAAKGPGEALWPGTWAAYRQAGGMLKADLARARKAWIWEATSETEREKRSQDPDFLQWENSRGEFADFHALRATYITRLVEAGASPKVAQVLARHSTITLTMDRYTKRPGAVSLASAVNAVASLWDGLHSTESQTLRATGTDDSLHTPMHTKCTRKGDIERDGMKQKESKGIL